MKSLALTLATLATLAATAGIARAEGCPDENDGEKKQGKFHIEYVNGKPVTVIDTVVSVCGKVPRPSVAYVLTPKNIDYEWESLKQDFMPLILATVKKAPF
ncbi:MAG: hypothetical protein KF773_01620 [Deltaproteobacteria bacterium]|nr:hypothetical protein [Deltaproteobacteria bacterium]MCW5800867.1 hypothetical protein [Deltaproteobacteria bacterium]